MPLPAPPSITRIIFLFLLRWEIRARYMHPTVTSKFRRIFLAGTIVAVPILIAIGFGVQAVSPMIEAPRAVFWFSLAAAYVSIAIFLWEEIRPESLRARIIVTLLLQGLVFLCLWRTLGWVLEKANESTENVIAQIARESKLLIADYGRPKIGDQIIPKEPLKVPAIKPRISSKLPEKPRPVEPTDKSPQFAVSVEFAIISFGGKDHGTGYWLGYRSPEGCSMSPIHAVLFIRLTNLQSAPSTVTGYTVEAGGATLIRLKAATDPVYWTALKSSNFTGGPGGGTIQFTQGPGQFSLVSYVNKDADFKLAIPIRMETFDAQIFGKSLPPHQMVRGWAFFEYPVDWLIPANLKINITDNLDRTFSYSSPLKNGNPNADALPRLMTAQATTNVSNCSQRPYFLAP